MNAGVNLHLIHRPLSSRLNVLRCTTLPIFKWRGLARASVSLRVSVSHSHVLADPANTDLASGAIVHRSGLHKEHDLPAGPAETSHWLAKISSFDVVKGLGCCLTPCSKLGSRLQSITNSDMVALRKSVCCLILSKRIVWK